MSYLLVMGIPLLTMASYFLDGFKRVKGDVTCRMNTYMSLIEIMLSIFLMPNQCKTSGINAWKRMSFTPAMSSVDLKYLSAESPPRLRRL